MRWLLGAMLLPLSACSAVLDFDPFRGGDAPADGGIDAGDAAIDAGDGGPDADACPAGGCAGGVVQVTAGGSHTCARNADGETFCWGANGSGQLGTGDMMDADQPRPLALTSSDISAGSLHTCAVVGGDTQCWGENMSSQLADGGSTSRSAPGSTDNGTGAILVAAGHAHTCIATGGVARCAGEWMNGRLGVGPRTSPLPRFDDVLTITDVIAVAAGGRHSCARVMSGELYCWGANAEGELGNGGTTEAFEPAPVSVLADVTAVATGHGHTCAINDGALYCWGRHEEGQLGQGASLTDALMPLPVTLPAPVTAVAAGDRHTCAIADGTLYCWGSNLRGQLGRTAGDAIDTPMAVAGFGAEVEQVDAGSGHTCAIDANRVLYCWGDNMLGQLGTGAAPGDHPTPEAVTFPR